MIRTLLSPIPGEEITQITLHFIGSSKNVLAIVRAKQKDLMSYSQSIGDTEVKILGRSPSGSLTPDITKQATTLLTLWRSCTCLTSARTSTIERVLCEIS